MTRSVFPFLQRAVAVLNRAICSRPVPFAVIVAIVVAVSSSTHGG